MPIRGPSLPFLDTRYVNVTGDESVAGIKTFSSFPVTPSSAPTTNYQVSNKKYVDDEVAGIDLSPYLLLAGGTMTGNLLFTDNTLDIGASGATRPRTIYVGTSVVSPLFTGDLTGTVTGAASLNVLKAGDTMTGALVITPTADGTSILNVTQADSTVVLNVDTTNGRVGIGTTAPGYPLDVAGNARVNTTLFLGTGGTLQINTGTSYLSKLNLQAAGTAASPNLIIGGGGLFYIAGNNLGFETGGTEAMRIASGNVGIGTTSPTYILEVLRNTSSAYVQMGGTGTNTGNTLRVYRNRNDVGTDSPLVDFIERSTSADQTLLSLHQWGTGDIVNFFDGASTEVFTILDGGNVGIGTTAPLAKLHITGSADDQQLIVQANATQTANILEVHDSSANVLTSVDGTGKISITQTSAGVVNATALEITVTGSGSASSPSLRGMLILMEAGYTGSAQTEALQFRNDSAGTSTAYVSDTSQFSYRPNGNRGIGGFAVGSTTGHNFGVVASAGLGAANYGGFFAATVTKNSATNVGVFASGLNGGTSPIQIGGYFTLFNAATAPNTDTSAALIADNAAQTSPIFLGRDNGTTVFKVIDGGATTVDLLADLVGLTVQGHSSQTANILEIQKSDGTVLRAVNGLGVAATVQQAITLAAGVTTFAVTSNVMTITGDGGANTVATITGGLSGQILTLIFVDGLVTITDTAAATANTVNLSAAFTGAANTVLQLVNDGNKWFEVSRSVN